MILGYGVRTMFFPKLELKFHDPFTGEKIEYSFKGILPNYENMPRAMVEYVSKFNSDDADYILKMMKFHLLLNGVENIAYSKMINIRELFLCGVIKEHELDDEKPIDCQLSIIQFAELLRKQLVIESEFSLHMTQQGYEEFKYMLLDEVTNIDNDLDNMFDQAKKKSLSKLNFIQRLKLFIKKTDFESIRLDAKKDALKLIMKTVYEYEGSFSNKRFSSIATELLENFDKSKYTLLLNEFIKHYLDSYGGNGIKYYKEQIKWLKRCSKQTNPDEIRTCLYWIIDNGASRIDAFKLILLEAEDISQEFYSWFYRQEYRRLRKKMTIADRRFYQLLFFRREIFDFRIPINEPSIMSFGLYYSDRFDSSGTCI